MPGSTLAPDIPSEIQRDLLAGRRPTILLNVDATRMSQAFAGSDYIQTIVNDEMLTFVQRYREVPELPVDLALRARFNPQLNKSWFGAVMQVTPFEITSSKVCAWSWWFASARKVSSLSANVFRRAIASLQVRFAVLSVLACSRLSCRA